VGKITVYEDEQKMNYLNYAEYLLSRYRKGIDDLPTLTLMLLSIPEIDVAGFLQKSIPHEERLQQIRRMRLNFKLPKDGISRLEELYLGRNRGREETIQ
jgi:hypothetical protein